MKETPYDDEPDWIDEAVKFLKLNFYLNKPENEDDAKPCFIISGLLEIMRDEGLLSEKFDPSGEEKG